MPTAPLQYLLSGTYAPEADPSGENLYKKPSWWERMWSQEAQRVAAENAAFRAQPTQAAQQHLIGTQEAARNFGSLPPEAQTLYGSPQQLFAQRGNAPTDWSSIRGGMGDQSFIQNGGVPLQTEAAMSGMRAEIPTAENVETTQRSIKKSGAPELAGGVLFGRSQAEKAASFNRYRQELEASKINLPELEAQTQRAADEAAKVFNENKRTQESLAQTLGTPGRQALLADTGVKVGQGESDFQLGQMPYTQYNRGMATNLEAMRLGGSLLAQPDLNREGIANAALGADIAETKQSMTPTLSDSLRKTIYGENIGASSTYNPMNPYYSRMGADGSRVTMSTPGYVPPELRTAMWMQQHPTALTGGGSGAFGGGILRDAKGNPVTLPMATERAVGASGVQQAPPGGAVPPGVAPAVAAPAGPSLIAAPQTSKAPTRRNNQEPSAEKKVELNKNQIVNEVGPALVRMGVLRPEVMSPRGSPLSDDTKLKWMKDSIPDLRAKMAGQRPAIQQVISRYIEMIESVK